MLDIIEATQPDDGWTVWPVLANLPVLGDKRLNLADLQATERKHVPDGAA
jgi:hypothetical protein